MPLDNVVCHIVGLVVGFDSQGSYLMTLSRSIFFFDIIMLHFRNIVFAKNSKTQLLSIVLLRKLIVFRRWGSTRPRTLRLFTRIRRHSYSSHELSRYVQMMA